jgi:hypothetical protein
MKRNSAAEILERAILEGRKAMPSPREVDDVGMRVLDRLREADVHVDVEPRVKRARPPGWWIPVFASTLIVVLFVALQIFFFVLLDRSEGVHLKMPPRAAESPRAIPVKPAAPAVAVRPKDRGQTIRIANAANGQTLMLTDGSRIELREGSELTIEDRPDGTRINLAAGSVIVAAVKQRGSLVVQTNACTVSVVGTVFAVTASAIGSRVAVLEGVVNVEARGGSSQILFAGEQFATRSELRRLTLQDEIAWSPNAATYLALLQPVRPQGGRGGGGGGGGRGGRGGPAPGAPTQAIPQTPQAPVGDPDVNETLRGTVTLPNSNQGVPDVQ